MYRVEAVRLAGKVSRRLRRTADATHLGQHMRFDSQLEYGLDKRGCYRVMTATGAQRGYRAFVIASRETEFVSRQAGVGNFRFCYVCHWSVPLRCASFLDFTEHRVDDKSRINWHAVIVQQRYQLGRVRIDIKHQHRSQLCIPVLFDNVDNIVLLDELSNGFAKRKGAYAAIIEIDLFQKTPFRAA